MSEPEWEDGPQTPSKQALKDLHPLEGGYR
jgi:hypothetical protein